MEKIFFIALTTILVSLPVYSSIITFDNGAINCDGIICPDNSTSCIVSKKTFGDLKLYKYTRLCSDASGLSTKTVEQQLPNPFPGTIINSISSYGGNVVLSDEEKKKIKEDIDQMVKEQQQYWQKWTSGFYAKLRKQFPPGFPFNYKFK